MKDKTNFVQITGQLFPPAPDWLIASSTMTSPPHFTPLLAPKCGLRTCRVYRLSGFMPVSVRQDRTRECLLLWFNGGCDWIGLAWLGLRSHGACHLADPTVDGCPPKSKQLVTCLVREESASDLSFAARWCVPLYGSPGRETRSSPHSYPSYLRDNPQSPPQSGQHTTKEDTKCTRFSRWGLAGQQRRRQPHQERKSIGNGSRSRSAWTVELLWGLHVTIDSRGNNWSARVASSHRIVRALRQARNCPYFHNKQSTSKWLPICDMWISGPICDMWISGPSEKRASQSGHVSSGRTDTAHHLNQSKNPDLLRI